MKESIDRLSSVTHQVTLFTKRVISYIPLHFPAGKILHWYTQRTGYIARVKHYPVLDVAGESHKYLVKLYPTDVGLNLAK